MEIKFNVTGKERKALVTAVSDIVGMASVYKGAPTFAYAVDNYIIDKNGTLSGNITQDLLDALAEKGFCSLEILAPAERMETEPQTELTDILTIEIPKDGFTDTAIVNLEKLVESKSALIKKAIGAGDLRIEQTEETLCFPWFRLDTPSETVQTYTRFIVSLCDMAKEHKRITATSKKVENEKYAFRCFLLRLGFIGKEYKADRKILLANLSGNSAFKSGDRKKETELVSVSPVSDYSDTAEMLADAALIHPVATDE